MFVVKLGHQYLAAGREKIIVKAKLLPRPDRQTPGRLVTSHDSALHYRTRAAAVTAATRDDRGAEVVECPCPDPARGRP